MSDHCRTLTSYEITELKNLHKKSIQKQREIGGSLNGKVEHVIGKYREVTCPTDKSIVFHTHVTTRSDLYKTSLFGDPLYQLLVPSPSDVIRDIMCPSTRTGMVVLNDGCITMIKPAGYQPPEGFNERTNYWKSFSIFRDASGRANQKWRESTTKKGKKEAFNQFFTEWKDHIEGTYGVKVKFTNWGKGVEVCGW